MKYKKFHFELLTRRLKFSLFSSYWLKVSKEKNTLWVNNSKSKEKNYFKLLARKLNFTCVTFELLIRSWKIKSYTSSYYVKVGKYLISLRVTNSMVKLLFFRFWVTNSSFKKKNISLRVTNSIVALLFCHFLVTDLKLINEKNSLNITVSKWHGLHHSITFFCI